MHRLIKIVGGSLVVLIAFALGLSTANLLSRQFASIFDKFDVHPIVWWGIGIGNVVLASLVMGAIAYGATRNPSPLNLWAVKLVVFAWPVVALGQFVGVLLGIFDVFPLAHPWAVVASAASYLSGGVGGIVVMLRRSEYWRLDPSTPKP